MNPPFWDAARHADRRPFLMARNRIVAALRNWFAHEGFVETEAAILARPGQEMLRPDLGPTSNVIDNRALVPAVTAMTIEATSSGAIVRAEAVMPSAGWWDPALVPENFGRPQGGVLTFRFVAAAPRAPVAEQNPAARTIVAAYALTQAQLDTTSEVVVVGEGNSRRARR